MNYYLFIDESGDHGIVNYNKDFPILNLTGILTSSEEYTLIKESMNKCKIDFFGNSEIILHSRDIRRRLPPFDKSGGGEKILFYENINNFFNNKFLIISTLIDKEKLIKKYSQPTKETYEFAFLLILERVLLSLKNKKCDSLKIIIESRGKKEDKELNQFYEKIYSNGHKFINRTQLAKLKTSIDFHKKKLNINGLQLADLASYPISVHYLYKERENISFEYVKRRLICKDGIEGMYMGYGLKIIP